MNVKVILQVAYRSAFRPSFCLNGSFARVFKIFSHRQTHTHTHTHTGPITLPLRKRGVIMILNKIRGNHVNSCPFVRTLYVHHRCGPDLGMVEPVVTFESVYILYMHCLNIFCNLS